MCNLFLYKTLINYHTVTRSKDQKANYFVPYSYTKYSLISNNAVWIIIIFHCINMPCYKLLYNKNKYDILIIILVL